MCSATKVISHADAMCAFRAAAQEGRIQRTPGNKYSESWKVVEASMYTTLNYFVLGAKHIMLTVQKWKEMNVCVQLAVSFPCNSVPKPRNDAFRVCLHI